LLAISPCEAGHQASHPIPPRAIAGRGRGEKARRREHIGTPFCDSQRYKQSLLLLFVVVVVVVVVVVFSLHYVFDLNSLTMSDADATLKNHFVHTHGVRGIMHVLTKDSALALYAVKIIHAICFPVVTQVRLPSAVYSVILLYFLLMEFVVMYLI
jgi:hypothetical protein